MTGPCEQPNAGPTCFVEALEHEYRRIRNKHMRYIFRYLLSKYPKDLLSSWWKNDGSMPWAVTQCAFKAYEAGIKSGDFRLYKGPRWKPQLKIIDGGIR
jgi:hypothetical protein